MNHRKFLASTALITSVIFTSAAMAQSPATAQVEPDDASLEEIIVTAQRRSENLQKAAIPVDVLTSAQLLDSGTKSPDLLTLITPSLIATPAGGSRTSFFLRGVGNFAANPTFESAIAINYDGVYLGRPVSTAGLFYDLERVEVLKGPQGTLYGRNATGGAINVLPVRPVYGEYEGYGSLSYGNYNAVVAEGAVNVPTGENSAIRVSGSLSDHDGYLSDGTSDDKTYGLRVQAAGELTPDLTVRISGDHAHVGGVGVGSSLDSSYTLTNPPAGPYVAAPVVLQGQTGPNLGIGLFDPRSQAFLKGQYSSVAGTFSEQTIPYSRTDNSFYGVNAEINLDTEVGSLVFVPAWRYTSASNVTSQGGYPGDNREKDKQSSLELRFNGERIGIFDYTVGGLYYHERNKGNLSASQQALAAFQYYDQTTESSAIFGRITANVSDRFRLVGGVRYTHDSKDLFSTSDQLVIACTNPVTTGCIGTPLIPYGLTMDDLGIALPPAPTTPAPTAIPRGTAGALLLRLPQLVVDNDVSFNKVTYRGAAEFDLTPSSLIYASVETGYRAGGLQAVNGFETYAPETITAYTAGSKNRFLDNRVQVNLEAFLWKYDDQHLAAIQQDGNGQQGFFIKNIGRTTTYGTEVEVTARLSKTTTVNVTGQYLHSEFDRFKYVVPSVALGSSVPAPYTGCAVSPPAGGSYTIDCSGRSSINAPKWTFNIGGSQEIPVGVDYRFVLSADTQYRSGRWLGFEFQPLQYQGATWQSNARIEFGPEDQSWSIAAFVRNIENDRYKLAVNNHPVFNVNTVLTAAPRTYGLVAGVRF